MIGQVTAALDSVLVGVYKMARRDPQLRLWQ